jgi:DNA-binding response OmpR family regulator
MEEEKCILVCDDDKSTTDLLRTILEKKGYHVETLGNSDKLFFKIDKCRPGLILMDINMPEIGGELAAELLKNHEETKDIPILMFSAHDEIDDITRKIGADGYISKPFNLQDLEKTIAIYFKVTSP